MEFWFSILALAAGPALFPVAKRHPRLLCGMDGFVLVAIAGLSLFHLLPPAIHHAGHWSLLTALAGVLGPFLFGRNLPHNRQRTVHNVFILVAVAGLALHAMIDGAALFHGTHHDLHDVHLGGMVAAVLIHRVPMSLLVWWSLRPRMGAGIAAGALGILGMATGAGYLLGGSVEITPALMGHLIAFVAGSLVHVVAHDTASDLIPRHCHDAWHVTYSAIGGAVAAVGLAFFGHMYRFEPAWRGFLALTVEAAPAILAGFGLVRLGVWIAARRKDSKQAAHFEGLSWLEVADRLTPWLGLLLALTFCWQTVAPQLGASLAGAAIAASHQWWEWLAAAALAVLLLLSYFRMGPRGMLSQLVPFEHHHEHGHHDHDHQE